MKNDVGRILFTKWKETIVDTSLFIAQWAVILCKWLWKEIKKFFRGSTWITYLIILILCNCLIINSNLKTKALKAVSLCNDKIDKLNMIIDSIEVDSKTNILLMKAGEYHITAHREKSKITKDSVASLLTELGAWYPDIIMAQIETESAYGESNVAINANNIIGMKKTGKRKTTQIKNQEYNGYGKYNNWESCVIDRVMWDYEFFGNKKPSRERYIEFINQFYAESCQYGTRIDRYSKSYEKYL